MSERYLKHLPLGLLFVYLSKSVFVTASLADAFIVAALVAAVGVFEVTVKSKRMSELEASVKAADEKAEELKDKIKYLEGNVSGLKLGLGARVMTNGKGQ